MEIRKATIQDLAEITAVEAECFPLAEAATEKDFEARLTVYPNHFWPLEDEGKLIASFGALKEMICEFPAIPKDCNI